MNEVYAINEANKIAFRAVQISYVSNHMLDIVLESKGLGELFDRRLLRFHAALFIGKIITESWYMIIVEL